MAEPSIYGITIGKVNKDEIYTVLDERNIIIYDAEPIILYKIRTNFGIEGYVLERDYYDGVYSIERIEPTN